MSTRLHVLVPPGAEGLHQVPDSAFETVLSHHGVERLRSGALTTLQLNVGKRCNQACHHCHVEAGPNRTETMSRATAERLVTLAAGHRSLDTVDITGGAPELNESFRYLVRSMRALGLRVIDRCNLTVLLEPSQAGTAEFLAEQGVDITASLPCYGQDNVDAQRGKGVFDKSIDALRLLNDLGYGMPDSSLRLDLVYNPGGASLPPEQSGLEARYRQELRDQFGLEFHSLLTITNMPIKRFAHQLKRDGKFEQYMSLLVNHFNPGTVDNLMCRSLISVGHDGQLYDCDFNQMLDMPLLTDADGAAVTLDTLGSLADLQRREIRTAGHCLGCTAGAGSSCGGALQ